MKLRLALGAAEPDRIALVALMRKTCGMPLSEAAALVDAMIRGDSVEVFDRSGVLARDARQRRLHVSRAEAPPPPIAAVEGALTGRLPDGTVVYNFLTPDMKAFLARCIGAAKAHGLVAKGTPEFSVLLGSGREVKLADHFDCEDFDGSLRRAVNAMTGATEATIDATGATKPTDAPVPVPGLKPWWRFW